MPLAIQGCRSENGFTAPEKRLGGMNMDAALLDVSARTIDRDWKMGMAWIRREITEGE